MKQTKMQYIDECALKAMQSMLHATYLSPGLMEELGKAAEKNQQTPNEEIAYRAHLVGKAMWDKRKSMFKDEPGLEG